MKKILFICIIALVALVVYINRPIPKFDRWEVETMKEVPVTTPISTDGNPDNTLIGKWKLTRDKSKSSAYIEFREDGTYILEISPNTDEVLLNEIRNCFLERYSYTGRHLGYFRVFNETWCGCTCDGSLAIIMYDCYKEEICRNCVSYYPHPTGAQHNWNKTMQPDPYVDNLESHHAFEMTRY